VNQQEHYKLILSAAAEYRRHGWFPIPLTDKAPRVADWPNLRLAEDDIEQAFRPGDNLGLILGEASGHLVDVDLDDPAAVRLAPHLLPPTPMRHGRLSTGLSHYWYVCEIPPQPGRISGTKRYQIIPDEEPEPGKPPKKVTLIEVRYTGGQTMVPPSLHPGTPELDCADKGELVQWAKGAEMRPPRIEAKALFDAAQTLAGLALLCRHWRIGARNELAMLLGGWWSKAGMPRERAEAWMAALCSAAHDDEAENRLGALRASYDKLGRGQAVAGWQELSSLLGEKVLNQGSVWLLGRAGRAAHPPDRGWGAGPVSGGPREPVKGRTGVNPYRYELSLLLNLTDEGNAERFLKLNGGRVLSCELLGGWYIWVEAEGRWRLDTTRRARDLARECARQMSGEALAIGGEDVNAKAAGTEETQKVPAADARGLCCHWASQTLGGQRMEALLSLAAADRRVAVEPDELDADPLLLNVQSHLLNLSAEGLASPPLPHDPGKRITKLAPVVFDPAAPCERWTMFLSEIFGADEALIAFMRRLAGYCLFGGNPEQVIAFLWGTGANGKSTFLETISELLGDYAATTTSETVLAREGGSNNQVFALARLKGARLVSMAETEEGQRLAESLVKVMTGGEKIAARFSHGNFFEFVPEFIPVVVTNHMPELRNVDEAMRRRVLLIPFRVTIAIEDRDPFLKRTLREELSGILNWALDGLREYYERVADGKSGLAPPPSVQTATAEYFEEQDPLRPFTDARCLFEPQARCTVTELYRAYVQHCEESGAYCLSQTRFGRRMKDLLSLKYNVPRDATGYRSGLSRWWLGIAINAGGYIPTPGAEPLL